MILPFLKCRDKFAFSPFAHKVTNFCTKLWISRRAAIVKNYFSLLKPRVVISAEHMFTVCQLYLYCQLQRGHDITLSFIVS